MCYRVMAAFVGRRISSAVEAVALNDGAFTVFEEISPRHDRSICPRRAVRTTINEGTLT